MGLRYLDQRQGGLASLVARLPGSPNLLPALRWANNWTISLYWKFSIDGYTYYLKFGSAHIKSCIFNPSGHPKPCLLPPRWAGLAVTAAQLGTSLSFLVGHT